MTQSTNFHENISYNIHEEVQNPEYNPPQDDIAEEQIQNECDSTHPIPFDQIKLKTS